MKRHETEVANILKFNKAYLCWVMKGAEEYPILLALCIGVTTKWRKFRALSPDGWLPEVM